MSACDHTAMGRGPTTTCAGCDLVIGKFVCSCGLAFSLQIAFDAHQREAGHP